MGKSNTNNKSDKTSSYTDSYYHFFRNILLVSIPLAIISAVILSSLHISATGSSSGTDNLTISISSACTLSSVVDSEHSASINAGTYKDNIGKTIIKTTCNDNNGYSIYANGYSNNKEGNNRLINTLSSSNVIETGLNTSGDISSWAMKLNNLPDDLSPTPPVIESAYDDTYGLIPSNWTKVLSLPSGSTDMSLGSSFTTTYAVYANSRQYTGTYQGQVKYILVHPSSPFKNLTMQSIATWKDIALPNEGDSTQAVDERDGKKYWVTRLADGNIWMTQNLDFDITANTTLNSNTTDLNVIYDNGQYQEYADGYAENNDIIYWTPASTATTIDFQNTGPISGWQSSNTAPYSASKTDSTETGHDSLGNWYNWTAAIASNDSSLLMLDTINNITKNPQNSICPKGWRLPTISSQSEAVHGSTNEYARLNYLYNSLISSPLYFKLAGAIRGASLIDLSTYGNYWSSSINSSDNAYRMSLMNNYSSLADYRPKNNGFSIRCVAR